jgi:hypothetical protein
MAKTIVWNRRASDSFNGIVSCLESNLGDKVTTDFVTRGYHVLDLITANPDMGSIEHHENK